MDPALVHLRRVAHGKPYLAMLRDFRAPFAMRRVDYVEFFAVMGGGGQHSIRNASSGEVRTDALRPGRIFLLRPWDVQFCVPGADGLRVVFVAIPRQDWSTFAAFAGLDPRWGSAPSPLFTDVDSGDGPVLEAFRTIVERCERTPTRFDLIEFWATVVPRVVGTSSDRDVPAWLSRALEAFCDEEHLPHGTARLARLAHVSPAHLAATTRRYLGRTPSELVAECRLQRAAELLADGDDTVARIAERCGFTAPAYFSTSFRRRYGRTPREHRALARRIAVPGTGLAAPDRPRRAELVPTR